MKYRLLPKQWLQRKQQQALKINESQYIALFMVSRSIKKLFSIDCVNIYLSQSIVNYLFSIDYIVIH